MNFRNWSEVIVRDSPTPYGIMDNHARDLAPKIEEEINETRY